jgi:hypothetical protein
VNTLTVVRQRLSKTHAVSSKKLICDRQSVDQFVWVSGLPMGTLTRFYLALLFSADNYLIILPKASSLTRRRVCSSGQRISYKVKVTVKVKATLLPTVSRAVPLGSALSDERSGHIQMGFSNAL